MGGKRPTRTFDPNGLRPGDEERLDRTELLIALLHHSPRRLDCVWNRYVYTITGGGQVLVRLLADRDEPKVDITREVTADTALDDYGGIEGLRRLADKAGTHTDGSVESLLRAALRARLG